MSREKIFKITLDILDAYFTRARINVEEAEVVDLLRLFFSLSVCLLVVSKSPNGSPAEQREKER